MANKSPCEDFIPLGETGVRRFRITAEAEATQEAIADEATIVVYESLETGLIDADRCLVPFDIRYDKP